MRAIQIVKFGGPKVLKLKEVNKPTLSSNQVLVKIIRAGVNPVDTYIREGAFINLPELPFTPGKDAAGVIESIGENVSSLKAGQRVFVCGRTLGPYGTYAEYSAVPEKDVFPLSDKLSCDQGAALGVPYFTAYRALVMKARCKAGETVLIHGASGAVGIAVVQLAKKLNLKVIGTAGSAEGLELVKENGADFVFNHKTSDYLDKIQEITNGIGVNIIMEMLANVNLAKDLSLLAPKGRVAIVGSRGPIKIDPREMMGPETEIVGVALLNSSEEEWREISKGILDGIEDGWVKPVIDRNYPLEQSDAAQEDIMSSRSKKGKIVIDVQDP